MQKYSITEEQRNIIVNYLCKQPYEQVFNGINMLMSLEKLCENEQENN